MKLIIAIIQPMRFDSVREALEEIEVERMTICDAQGYGAQRGRSEFRPDLPGAKLLRKVVLEVVVNDDFLDRTVETIERVARSGGEGAVGDGKILVLPIEEAVQVNDAARGPGAV